MIAPIAINVAVIQLALAPQGLPVVALVLVASLFLAWRHRPAFATLLRARAAAATPAVRVVELVAAQVWLALAHRDLFARFFSGSSGGGLAAVPAGRVAAAG